MAITKTAATWTQIDINSLPADIAKAYSVYKTSYAAMKEARLHFETKLAHVLDTPQGKRAVFGYNFGKLSIAIVDDDKPATKATSAVSLSTLVKRA